MALLPKLNLVNIALDASTITLVDATGEYSTSNVGGFGPPNPIKADVTSAIFGLYKICSPSVVVRYRENTLTNLFAAGEVFSASRFPGITNGNVYADGVYGIKYGLAFAGTGNITFTGGSKQFTLTNAATIFASAIGFVLPSTPYQVYYIDKTKTLDAAGGYVTSSLPTVGATSSFEIIYEGDLKLLIDKAGERCLTEDIGIWAMNGCADEKFRNIQKRFMQRIALKSKFTQGYLFDADKLAVDLANYCDCTTPYQPCNC
jgi:hypothetical protein